MGKHCWRIFSYLVIDRAAAMAELERMARQGWELERLYFSSVAKFRATQRAHLHYALDLTVPRQRKGKERQVPKRADADWELVAQADCWDIYASRPGTSPDPVRTDPAQEYALWRGIVRQMWVNAAAIAAAVGICAIILFLLLGRSPDARRGEAARRLLVDSNSLIVLTVLLPLLLVWGCVYGILVWRRMAVWRTQAREGHSLSAAAPSTARLWGGVRLACILCECIVLLFLVLDALLNRWVQTGWAVGTLIGGAIVLAREWVPNRRTKQATACMLLALGVLVCTVLHGPFRRAFPGRFPAQLLLEEQGAQPDTHNPRLRSDTFLGSRAVWWERMPASSPGEIGGQVRVEAWTWAGGALADWAFRIESAQELTGLEEDIWGREWDGGAQGEFLLRQGRSWARIEWYHLEPETVLTAAEKWLARSPS